MKLASNLSHIKPKSKPIGTFSSLGLSNQFHGTTTFFNRLQRPQTPVAYFSDISIPTGKKDPNIGKARLAFGPDKNPKKYTKAPQKMIIRLLYIKAEEAVKAKNIPELKKVLELLAKNGKLGDSIGDYKLITV
jgi:hypothetical protein